MSTLHKQNFDLKLELFHRRERQTVLEEKIELLESEKSQAEETNDRLLQELEKRDKAIAEAVQMILSLETRVESLARERQMIRQLEENTAFLAHLSDSPSATLVNHTDTPRAGDTLSPGDKHKLARVPSFMSERSENTENLRNVYLHSQASYMTLSKSNSRSENHGFASPSTSILSESSFVSIYGQKDSRDSSLPPDIPRNPARKDKIRVSGRRSVSMPLGSLAPTTPQRSERPGSQGGVKRIITPHRKLEKLESSPNIRAANQQESPSMNDILGSTTTRPIKPQPLTRVRSDTERFGRKGTADSPATNSHALPPTPDTVRSSMLSQTHNSDEDLHGRQSSSEAKYPVLSRHIVHLDDKIEPGQWQFKDSNVSQAPSVTAFTGRQETPASAYYENHTPLVRRPRSVDETTISRHRNDWDSGSEMDDAASGVSSFDYWMKEGLQPSRGGAPPAQNGFSPTPAISNYNPPDLFGLPSDSDEWKSGDMLTPRGGSGCLSSNGPLSPPLNDLGVSLVASSLEAPGSLRPSCTTGVPPPAPYRSSSLNAHTSTPGTPMTTRFPGIVEDGDGAKRRSVSGHTLGSSNAGAWPVQHSGSQTPTPLSRTQVQQQDNSTQKRHYPPIAGQQPQQAVSRPRSRGITSLFRRSLGSASLHSLQSSASVPATHSPFGLPSKKDPQPSPVGVPAWERRNELLDDMTSATPPPILRSRAMTTSGEFSSHVKARVGKGDGLNALSPGLGSGLSKVMKSQDGGAPLAPIPNRSQGRQISSTPTNHGHSRRWFSLSRVTNFKNTGS